MNLQHFLQRKIQPTESIDNFWNSDQFPLDDEAIADLAVNAMLLVMNDTPRTSDKNNSISIEDYAALPLYGVRFPWKDRISLRSEVDLTNDELCDMAVIGLTRNTKNIFSSAVYAVKSTEKDIRKFKALCGATSIYRVGWIEGTNPLSRASCDDPTDDIESIVTAGYAGVMPDGCCVGCSTNGATNFQYATTLAYVIGMHNDRRFFWDVQATEEFWDGMPAKAHFSIDKEYVKSLFYARSIPTTEKGRLRPILHWVRSHKRRMKEGIDIDIDKHLRGIDEFGMHGLNFQINAPRKVRSLSLTGNGHIGSRGFA